jgi:hypothetical protein
MDRVVGKQKALRGRRALSYLSSDAPIDLPAHSHPTFQRGGQGATTGADLYAAGEHIGWQFIIRGRFRQGCNSSGVHARLVRK